jgi:hypothetical protein
LVHAQQSEVDDAASEFKAAYEASPNYSVLYNLGRTYLVMGRAVDASDTLTRYLLEGGAMVEPKRRAEVSRIILQCEKRIGSLELSELPADATVEIDGRSVPSRTFPIRLVAGAHSVVVNAPELPALAQAFSIVPGKTTRVRVQLPPLADPDRARIPVAISCPITDVNVAIDESSVGVTPIERPVSLAAGEHQFHFRRPGYVPVDLTWTGGSSGLVDCAMRVQEPLGENAATLHVDASEREALVIVDGKPVSETRLPFGRHRVEVRKLGFKTWTSDVYLYRGESKRLAVTLAPLREQAEPVHGQARSQKLIGYGMAGAGTALLLTAGALALASSHAYSDWRGLHDEVATTPVTDANYGARQEAATRKALRVQALDTWALSSAIVGGLGLICGTALVLTSAGDAEHEPPTLRVTRDTVALDWRHAF